MSPRLQDWSLACATCGYETALGPLFTGCPACTLAGEPGSGRGVLEARFAPPVMPARPQRDGAGLKRYRALLPGGDAPDWIGLGSGDTPLVRSRHIGKRLGLDRLWFKVEAANPTGSFKDRYVAVSANLARRFGFERVVVSSTGNLGVSVAAYAAALGLECLVIVLPSTPGPIVRQILSHGAEVASAPRDARQAVFERIGTRCGWFPIGLLLPRPVQNPFGVEGYRTLAWEMIEALGEAPGMVLFPCARGNGLYGAYKGFVEARAWGWAGQMPAMVACQPEGANSLEVSLQRRSSLAVELPPIDSIAMSASETVADDRALIAIRESAGDAVSVDDAALIAATADLAREGLCVEPSSALPVAGLARLLRRSRIERDTEVVCVLTATGTRWPQRPPGQPLMLPTIATASDVERFLDERPSVANWQRHGD